MGAVAVLHEDEVPIELGVAGEKAKLLQLLVGVGAALHSGGELMVQLHQFPGHLVGAGLDLLLDAPNLPGQVGVALGAVVVQQLLILQGADQVVAGVLAVLRGDLAHVAVGAGEGIPVGAARAQIGLQLGVLHLDLAHAGAGADEVIEHPDAVLHLPDGIVVVGQDLIRMHGLQAVMGQGDGAPLRVGVEEILVVALAAGEVGRVDVRKVLAHAGDQVGMGGDQVDLAVHHGAVGVAVEAADGLGHHAVHLGEGLAVGRVALLQDHGGHAGGLAGPAAGLGGLAHAQGLPDVVQVKGVTAGGHVVLGEAVGGVELHQVGVVLQIIGLAVVLAVLGPGGVLVGIGVLPVHRGQHMDMAVIALELLHIRLLAEHLGLDQVGVEGRQANVAAVQRVDDGGVHRLGAHGGAGDAVHLHIVKAQALGAVDLLGHVVDGLAADALGLLVLQHAHPVDPLAVGHDLHTDGAVAPLGAALQGEGGLGDLAVPVAGHGGAVGIEDADHGQEQQQAAADQADPIQAQFLFLFLFHFVLPGVPAKSVRFQETPFCLFYRIRREITSPIIPSPRADPRYRPRRYCPAGS